MYLAKTLYQYIDVKENFLCSFYITFLYYFLYYVWKVCMFVSTYDVSSKLF